MKIIVDYEGKEFLEADVKVFGAFQKQENDKKTYQLNWQDKKLQKIFQSLKINAHYSAGRGEWAYYSGVNGELIKVYGMGDKTKLNIEGLRRDAGTIFRALKGSKVNRVGIHVDSFNFTTSLQTAATIHEAFLLTDYSFDKYLTKKHPAKFDEIILFVNDKKLKPEIENIFHNNEILCDSINLIRNYINEAPNVLHSEAYAQLIAEDVSKNLENVKITILDKDQIQQENMNLFLSVNAGSFYQPRFVHLSYTPQCLDENSKHIALVGKGITFDTGGYSLKPSTSLVGMKGDMGGSATVYGAFRAAVMMKANIKLDCILAITDNVISSIATKPDAIVRGRSGITVEIQNTDAEGRLVLADALDYVCDLKPDVVIDVATLTGACLVALGNQVCAILGNNNELIAKIKESADITGEYMWQLPIIDEWKDDIKSKIADIKNIGTPMRAGTSIGAAFLERFIKNDVSWAHIDIAGVSDSQKHLPYCPDHGASGLIVRTLVHYIMNVKM